VKISGFNSDVCAGIILAFAGGYFYSITLEMVPEATVFPKIILVAFIILSLMMAVQSFIKGKTDSEKNVSFQFSEWKIPLLIFVFITIYVVALEYAGFYIATAAFIPIVALFYKHKKPLHILVTTIGMIGFIHLLFVVQLKLVLP
jgi:hypothetical protein